MYIVWIENIFYLLFHILRPRANNDFEKNFYKLLNNNAIYGKTMENLRLRTDIRLANKWDGRGKNYGRNLIAQHNFKTTKTPIVKVSAEESHGTT